MYELLTKDTTLIWVLIWLFGNRLYWVIIYYIKKYQERKEAIRQVELTITLSINSMFQVLSQLESFIERLEAVIKSIEWTSDNSYSLEWANFPPIVDIYFDEEITKMKFSSYYLHNKILASRQIINWQNKTMHQFRDDYIYIMDSNKFIFWLWENLNPTLQRKSYAENLHRFCETLKVCLKAWKSDHLKSLIQLKVYNWEMMEENLRAHRLCESATCKYFYSHKQLKEYQSLTQNFKRIEKYISYKVEKLYNEILIWSEK